MIMWRKYFLQFQSVFLIKDDCPLLATFPEIVLRLHCSHHLPSLLFLLWDVTNSQRNGVSHWSWKGWSTFRRQRTNTGNLTQLLYPIGLGTYYWQGLLHCPFHNLFFPSSSLILEWPQTFTNVLTMAEFQRQAWVLPHQRARSIYCPSCFLYLGPAPIFHFCFSNPHLVLLTLYSETL